MNNVLQLTILKLIICAGSLSAQSRTYMDVKIGSSIALPCDWRSVLSSLSSSESLHVEWRTFTETVFERLGGEQYQGEGYEGRVDVPEDKLKTGNCSLVLKNVKPDDAGVYECYLLVKRVKRSLRSKRVFIQSVELSVDDTPDEKNSGQDKQAGARGRSNSFSNAGVISVPSEIITFTILINTLFWII